MGGDGGATEGDIRGTSTDEIESLSGVVDLDGGHLLVHEAGTPAMTVVVDAGVGYIPNDSFDETDSDSIKFWEAVVAGTTGSRTLVIGANASGQTRIDLTCIKIDPGATPDEFASDIAELIIVAGTPGAGVPATPAFYLKLAEVTVLNAATEITDAKIADSREQITIKNAFIPSTLTGKGITKRVGSVASATSITPNIDLYDEVIQTNTGGNGTLTLNAPTGTPTDGKVLIVRIKSTNSQTYAFNGAYRASTNMPFPETHAGGSKFDYLGFIYNDLASKWDLLALLQDF
jgi:hypothetical protein